eukprot:COSAG02_NODE_55087_length_292_cov_1.067358_1_plen_57_part_10
MKERSNRSLNLGTLHAGRRRCVRVRGCMTMYIRIDSTARYVAVPTPGRRRWTRSDGD